MGLKYWLCAVLTLLLIQSWCCEGCLEQERTALLQLKIFFNGRPLRNWGRGDHNSDCCQWERVECNPSTGRVIALYLNHTRAGLYHGPHWFLNTSLFLPFEELKRLYLPGNRLAGCIENEGFDRLSEKLSNLEILDLSWNFFNNNIMSSLSELPSLKSLNLAENNIDASNHMDGFHKLSQKLRILEILDLSGNTFNNNIWSFLSELSSLKSLYLAGNNLNASNYMDGFHRLSKKLRNLEILDLRFNFFNKSILSSLSELSSLKSLNLARNNFKTSNHMDATNFEKLSRLHKLEFLDISDNDLQNNILSYLGNLSSLKTLIISDCGLKGTISTRGLSKLINLKKLDMSQNEIESFESSQEERKSLRFVHLEVLDLRENFFNNSVLSFVNEFTSLKSLDISYNNLKGLVDVIELDALRNLEELDMSRNMLNQFVAATKANKSFRKLKTLRLGGYDYKGSDVQLQQLSLEAFSSLKTLCLFKNNINKTMLNQTLHVLSNLEELFLYSSPLDNNFLQTIGAFTSLKSISLEMCGLTDTLPTQGWCDLKNLKELSLYGNELSGILPSCLGNLTSLRLLDISGNQFIGNVTSFPLTNLPLLQFLSISNNHFQVPDSFKSFANHSNLKIFLSDFNQLVSEHDHVQTRVPKFQLIIFSMSYCGAKEHLIKPPSFLYYQYDLKYVDLSFNKFGGALPYWLFENNTRLERFVAKNNSFVGPFHLPSHPCLDVIGVDISNNPIHGQIPSNISLIFPFVKQLLFSGNALEGEIPKWLGEMNFLEILDLSNNQFSGSIPDQLAMGNSLYSLRLSNNNLSGKIAAAIFNSQSLIYLYLDGNNFEGEIPQPSSSSFLEVLDISNNNLSGKLPRWIRNLTQLDSLILSNNYFEGSISKEFCYNDYLEFLDLSHNNLSGSLPSCSNPSITHLYLSKNRLNGPWTHSFYNISSLVVLDLRENNLTGGIPQWIGNFSQLSILLLKGNNFFGEIPIEVCEMEKVSMIDLSHNQLSGSIPSCLSHLSLKPSTAMYFWSSYLFILETLDELRDEISTMLRMTTMMEEELLQVELSLFTIQLRYVKDEVEFTTKSCSYTYEGYILHYMSGIDLSCNKLTGLIPPEMGNLSEIHSLNLSHNNLSGPIPSTFSNLTQIESLDLSFNNLNGHIPSQLIQLNYLEVFSVAHNNLSGTIPYGKAQFATFEKSSYEGNPLLCGPPLDKSCKETNSQPKVPNCLDEEKECSSIDMDMFHISFAVTYVIVLVSIVAVLYINPYWRRAWFYLAERGVTNCYYFIVDNLMRF